MLLIVHHSHSRTLLCRHLRTHLSQSFNTALHFKCIFHSLLVMKQFLSFWLAFLGSCLLSSAFPTAANVALLARSGGLEIPDDLSLEDVFRHVERQKRKRLLINPLDSPIEGTIFNHYHWCESDIRKVDGGHAWQAPDFDAGAQRGPCPGLNALANHGYIDRSGVAKVTHASTTLQI